LNQCLTGFSIRGFYNLAPTLGPHFRYAFPKPANGKNSHPELAFSAAKSVHWTV
jgi:hypothetical protein